MRPCWYVFIFRGGLNQPPPKALRFSHRSGERETRVTGDELQGTMGRVQLSPSRLPLRACFKERRLGTRQGLDHVVGWRLSTDVSL